ncbi:translocation/assembly module TamB domain-containing protein [Azospirillum griseum]|uniref:translocation/assembly module TamB domain-containing protein n=1 Tax=Azospirillum griseum TaxID=2496639 RepID=UPI0036451B5F
MSDDPRNGVGASLPTVVNAEPPTVGPPTGGPPSRHRRARPLRWLLGLGVVLLALTGAVAWLDGAAGRRWLADRIEAAVSGPDLRLRIDAIGGRLPFDPVVTRATLADGAGEWLVVEGARVTLRPGDLLDGLLRVERLEAERVDVRRAPVSTGAPPPSSAPAPAADLFALPRLPVGVALDRVAVERLSLGPALLGEAATLRVGASLALPMAAGLDARLSVTRLDAPSGTTQAGGSQSGALEAVVSFQPDTRRFDATVTAAEPAGGVLARALALPGLPPLGLDLTGGGRLEDWRGALSARIGTGRALRAEATIQRTAAGHSLTVTAQADPAALPAGLLDPALARLVGARPRLDATALRSPDGALALSAVTVEAAAGRMEGSGAVGADRQRLSLRWSAVVPPDSPLRALTPTVDWTSARADGAVDGRLDDLAISLSAAVTGVLAGDAALGPLVGPVLAVQGKGRLDAHSGRLTLDGVEARAASARLTARGVADGWGRRANATLSVDAPELDRFAALAGLPLRGALALDAPLRLDADGRLSASLSGRWHGLSTGTPADALLGSSGTLTATDLERRADGGLRLGALAVAGDNGRIGARGTLADGRLDAALTLDGTGLEPLGVALGLPLAGRLSVDLAARGPLDGLEVTARTQADGLSVDERRWGRAELTATLAGLPRRPVGTLALRAEPEGVPLTLDLHAAPDGAAVALSDLRLMAGNNRLTGNLRVLPAGDSPFGLATGRLEGSFPDLKALSPLAALALAGKGGGKVDLGGALDVLLEVNADTVTGRQVARINATANGLRVSGLDGGPLTLRRLTMAAEVADARGTPSGKATLSLSGAGLPGAEIASLTAQADGGLANAALRLSATGRAGGEALSLDVAGVAGHAAGESRLRLDRLEARYAGESLRLTSPATLTASGDRRAISGLRAQLAGARLSLDASQTGEALKGELRLDQLPLALARLADPSLALEGVAGLQASVAGTVRSPRADATLRVTGLRAKPTAQAGLPGLDATITGQWRSNRLSLTGTAATPKREAALTLRAALPLLFNPDGGPEGGAVTIPPKGALDASLGGTIDAALLNDLLAATGDRARGILRLDVRAGGTVAAPRLSGSVVLTDGRFENRASGAVLTGIDARLVGDGDALTIDTLRAKTRSGGTLSGQGVIRPTAAADRQIDVRLTADNARLVENELLTADVDAALTVTGGFRAARLAGPLRLRGADVRIPNRMPVNVVDLRAEEVGPRRNGPTAPPPPRRLSPRKAADAPPPPFALALDVALEAPGRIFVRGRGLDAELGGSLRVGGRADAPEVTGRLTLQKGRLDVLSHTFTFTRGTLDFDGTQPIDPRLDLLAEATANSVTAQIEVTGTAAQPKIALTSPQGLPQDEILSAVLFGKSVGNLGAAEAVQLAQSAAALTGLGGEGGGLLDRVRRGVGLDRLDFSQGSDGKGGAVKAGRYLDDGVYVGVEQGMGGNQTRVTVEVDITRGLKGKAEVGADSDTRFGLTYEKDY